MRNKIMAYMKNKVSAGLIFRIMIWVIMIAIYLPYLFAAKYAIFKADDFSGYVAYMVHPGNSFFEKCLNCYTDTYMNFQGTWSSEFVYTFFNPIHLYSYSLLRAMLIGTAVATLISLFLMMHIAMEYFNIGRKNAVFFIGLVLIPLLLFRDYTEIYLWFTGMAVYLLPLLFFCIGFSFLLLGEMKNRRLFFFLSAVFMVLMTGGVLEVVGFGMFWLLLFITVEYLRTGKINKRFTIIFVLSLLGALINAFAPGNFGRKEIAGGEINVLHAVFVSIETYIDDVVWFSENTIFIAFVILAFLLGCYIKVKIKDSVTITAILGLIITPVITIFPVALGIGASVKSSPVRCLFILDIAVISCIIGASFLAGNKLFEKNLLPDIKTVTFVLCVAALLAFTHGGKELTDYIPISIAKNLKNGFIQEYENDWQDIFSQIEHSDNPDVVVTGMPEVIDGCISPDITDDPENWVNECVANYFGKRTVRVISQSP